MFKALSEASLENLHIDLAKKNSCHPNFIPSIKKLPRPSKKMEDW